MTSEQSYGEAYVWFWLPGSTEPVVAGRLARSGGQLHFNYGRSYLKRPDAIAIYDPELPLRPGASSPAVGLSMPNCLRDASPDAWGRRVIMNKRFAGAGRNRDPGDLDELTYLLESGSDRIGALDIQVSPTRYVPRLAGTATLDELQNAIRFVEQGAVLTPELDQALFHGTSLGGARPKAMIVDGGKKYIAKFSSTTDVANVVKAEFVAMRLAARVGLKVAPVKLTRAGDKDVLLIERFDRERTEAGWRRKMMVSALTLLSLDEMMARYASYEELSVIVRHRFRAPKATLRELFSRIAFNVLCGNTDDHARNHAAFWDGRHLVLTPAYDICPQPRTGNEASHAMLIVGDDRMSRVTTCLKAAPNFLLAEDEAAAIIGGQVRKIIQYWPDVCDEGALDAVDRGRMWRRQILNPYALDGAPAAFREL